MINALSIDVEEYFQVEAFAEIVRPNEWESFTPRVVQNTEKILDLLDRFGVKATFFCLGWVAQRHPGLIKKIAAQGHEVASHGFSHRPLFRLTPKEFRKEIRESKKILEDLSGQEIQGFRAPTYSITRKTLWGLEILAEEGYRYDSSIFPIHHDLYGFPEAPRFPFKVRLKGKDLRLIEFPASTVKIGKINWPVAGGGYFRLFPYTLTRIFLSRINVKEDRPFVFYLHPWELDPDQPRIKHAPLKSRFRHYLNLQKTEKKFKRLLSDFRFAPIREIIQNLKSIPEHLLWKE